MRAIKTSIDRAIPAVCITALALTIPGCAPRAATPPATVAPASSGQAQASLSPVGYRPEFGTMWTFDAPPLEYWKSTYGFTPDQAWLDHVRLASVRLPNCSSAFVSSNGLVLTNQHCVRDCAAEVSPTETDYNVTGFVARTLNEEKKCPGMFVDELQSIENVTEKIRTAVTAQSPQQQALQRTGEIDRLQTECAKANGLTCQVVSLYQGGIYSVYKYKRYNDVRLAFMPEEQAAIFGGDPDNFVYPRHDLDFGLLRVYDGDRAHKPKEYLQWSTAGAADGEVVFVIGNPGSTGRLNTMSQLEFLRDTGYPGRLASYERGLALFRGLSGQGEAAARRYEGSILNIENSQKAFLGYASGLADTMYMRKKAAFENEFRTRLSRDPRLAQYNSSYDEIAAAQRELAAFDTQLRFHSFGPSLGLGGSRLLTMAGQLVRLQAQSALPDSARLAPYRGNLAATIRASLLREQSLDTALEVRAIAMHLAAAAAQLPPNDPYVRAALAGRTPEQAATALASGTRVGDLAFRRSLVDGGPAAVASSTDPLIALARIIDPLSRALVMRAERLNATILSNTERIGRALFEKYGTALPPDATFTLRITDGVVKGYPYNGTVAPYKTTFYGLYDRADSFDGKYPFSLTPRWIERKNRLDLSTPLNFVSTTDIIGGNSGSPIVNKKGELVGVAFDGNIESLPNNFLFTTERARTVGVDSRAMIETMRKIYDATALADELQRK